MKKSFDVSAIAFLLRDYRNRSEYKKELGYLYEITMSCERTEAAAIAHDRMMDALNQATGTRNDVLRVQFLAAYDLKASLEK